MDLRARRPTRFRSSPCPAIPTIKLPRMSSTTISLIIRRKMLDSGFSAAPTSALSHTSWSSHPTTAPATVAMMIHWLSEIRFSGLGMSPSDECRRLRFDAFENLVVGLRELGHAFALELARDPGEIDTQGGERAQPFRRQRDALPDADLRDAVVAIGVEGFRWQRRHAVRRHQRIDVVG